VATRSKRQRRVSPPTLADHTVEGLDQVREVLGLRQHRPPPPRVRQRPDQQMRVRPDTASETEDREVVWVEVGQGEAPSRSREPVPGGLES
jgi:hypothetical protein